MPGKLICFGDLCVDVVGRTNQASTGSDVTLADLSIRAAGAAVNCALSAAAEGVEVQLVGLLGDDVFSQVLRSRLAEARVGTSHVRTRQGVTGTVISIVDSAGQTQFYSHRGVNSQAYGELPSDLVTAEDFVYLSGYSFQESGSRLTAERLLASDARCALDPSFQFARDYNGDALNIELLLPNLEEARLMTGQVTVEKCAAALRKLGPKTVVVKLGADGCYIDSQDVKRFVRSQLATAIDTTGAGDSFAGAFLAATLQGQSVIEAAERANHSAGALVARKR